MFGLDNIKGIIFARSAIVHGGNEKTGSTVMLNRKKFIVNGKPKSIPVINGNAIRGNLRRKFMWDFLANIGYNLNIADKSGLKLYHALFTGGILETVSSKDSGAIDIEFKKKIVKYLTPVVLFGTSWGNQMVESKLKVGDALPICRELKRYIPKAYHTEQINLSFHELIDNPFQTRKDDIKAEREQGEQARQMIIDFETFSAGTEFYHEFKLEDGTDVERSAVARMINIWKMKPFIGGKSAEGYGEVELEYDYNMSEEEYLNFLKDNRDTIVQILDDLQG